MDGVLIIDKPQGMTSADVVRVVKRQLRCKTGHLGTLDPFATGVLPVCIGEGTKIAQFLNTAEKAYSGIIRLGQQTDTGDLTGAVIQAAPVPTIAPERLAALAHSLRGELVQIPPMYSAIKREGTPLYRLARQGIAVERQPRRVHIAEIDLARQSETTLAFSVACSKGTYVRVLAELIGTTLGTVAHLEALRRTRFGHFGLDQAIALTEIEQRPLPVIGLRQALAHLREIPVDAAGTHRARQGYEPLLGALSRGGQDEAAKLVGPMGELAAVIVADGSGRWRFGRVFASP